MIHSNGFTVIVHADVWCILIMFTPFFLSLSPIPPSLSSSLIIPLLHYLLLQRFHLWEKTYGTCLPKPASFGLTQPSPFLASFGLTQSPPFLVIFPKLIWFCLLYGYIILHMHNTLALSIRQMAPGLPCSLAAMTSARTIWNAAISMVYCLHF